MRKVTTLYLYVWSSFKTSPYFMSVFMSANYWVVERLCYCLNESKPMCDLASHSREVLVRCALYQAGLQAGARRQSLQRLSPPECVHSPLEGPIYPSQQHHRLKPFWNRPPECRGELRSKRDSGGNIVLGSSSSLPRISLHGFGYQLHLDVRIT